MKWFIASDIHGSAYYCRKMLERYKAENADRMLLLGDILYHGPRNDLPEGYAPKEVIGMLNAMKDEILCVRGNCEAEVDQMVLKFPVLAEYAIIDLGNSIIYATHGHIYNENNLPPMKKGDILLHGHTHVPKCVEHEDYTYESRFGFDTERGQPSRLHDARKQKICLERSRRKRQKRVRFRLITP